MKNPALTLVIGLLAASGATIADTPSPVGANAYIVSPRHGEIVTSPVKVIFGLSGAGVAPAGVDRANTGHHHLLVDTGLPAFDKPIPADDSHRHFGGGQTEATIELQAGRHTLQLLLADHQHVAHSPPIVSEQITITVE